MDDRGRDQILSEQLLSELQAIREYVAQIPEITATLAEHSAILKEHSTTLKEHSLDLKEIKGLLVDQMERTVSLEATAHTH